MIVTTWCCNKKLRVWHDCSNVVLDMAQFSMASCKSSVEVPDGSHRPVVEVAIPRVLYYCGNMVLLYKVVCVVLLWQYGIGTLSRVCAV